MTRINVLTERTRPVSRFRVAVCGTGQEASRTLIYLTQHRLMCESETTIQQGAMRDGTLAGRVCRQVVDDPIRYAVWHGWHDPRMSAVASRNQRERQIIALRAVHLEQVHRAALVRYLRKHQIVDDVRDATLRAFYGLADPKRAAVSEHRVYVTSVSSQLCAHRLLTLVGDRNGVALIKEYQGTYMQYFEMFCENARAMQANAVYLLRSLIPEAKAEADALRARVLRGEGLPARPVAVKSDPGRSGLYRTAGAIR